MFTLILFLDAVQALRTVWCIGDGFLRDIDHMMATLKTSEQAQQGRKLYLHQYFNFETFFFNPLSPVKTSIARIFNALVKALNKYQHLPAYIVVMW